MVHPLTGAAPGFRGRLHTPVDVYADSKGLPAGDREADGIAPYFTTGGDGHLGRTTKGKRSIRPVSDRPPRASDCEVGGADLGQCHRRKSICQLDDVFTAGNAK